MISEIKQGKQVAFLFKDWQETLIWSCLQNVMGHLYVDSLKQPQSAMAFLGDFCFLAGKPDQELVLYKPECCKQDFIIMVPQSEPWAKLIEDCYKKKAEKVIRYAMKKEPDVFDRTKLQHLIHSLPDGFSLKMMDSDLFYLCKELSWCEDWVAQYSDYEMYQKYGLGAIVLKEGKPVSGASSYSSYLGGIEIEIDTKEEYRRKGLASICGAKLILECLNRGWYPSWDAQNTWSVGLAKKLGYHYDHEYTAYEIWDY